MTYNGPDDYNNDSQLPGHEDHHSSRRARREARLAESHESLTEVSPLRNPEGASARTRSGRAIMLLLLTIFVPGGAQIVAGNRKIGRFALTVTLICWAALLVILALFLIDRGILFEFFANTKVQFVLAIVLAALAVGWLLLFANTLFLIKPKLLAPGMLAIVSVIAIVAVLATSGLLGYGSYVVNTGRDTITQVFEEGPAFEPVDGRYNLLVLGGDAGENRVSLRPDSTSIWSVDAKTGQIAIISIPRNFQNTPFPESSPMHKLYPNGFNCGDECIFNAIYSKVEEKHKDLYPGVENPGAQATMEGVEGITGLKIQGYVVVDMAGFSEFINAMGGVDINSGGWVPWRGPVRTDTAVRTRWFEPGTHHFTGEQALWYARSRYFTSDYHRIRRQQCMQDAMVKQFNPQTVITRFGQIMSAGKQLVQTNIPQSQLGSFVNLADKSRDYDVTRLTLGAPDFGTAAERFSTYPDFDQIKARIPQVLAEASGGKKKETESAAPTSAASSSSASGSASASAGASTSAAASASASSSSDDEVIQETETVPTTQPDGSPITEDYLIQLEAQGNTGLLELIASTNSKCSAG
ncbi:LCP family protein [Neomicrococcus lactis]|uniref:LCP family protein required for cell wall assembly n=1 Tax=Neomicrococcus lactis TaxID=732241 RepID=A0A7W8YB38_9MICC|nr:LCP family protein required for cell wall assembly [Neomicrococcus lactis]